MSDPDAVDPIEYRDKLREAQEREIKDLFTNLPELNVLFYPACGLNWQPLRTFAVQFDLFIYNDWGVRWSDFNNSIRQLEHATPVGEPFFYQSKIVEDVIRGSGRQLSSMENLPWVGGTPDGVSIGQWCELVKLIFRADDEAKPFWLLFMAGNPIETYRNLFSNMQTAPQIVYLRRPAGIPRNVWGAFVADDGPLASAILENPHQPLHVLNDIGAAALV